MHVRYCPECDQEFRPHVERCSDCGGPLEDQFEEHKESSAAKGTLPAPPIGYNPIALLWHCFDWHGTFTRGQFFVVMLVSGLLIRVSIDVAVRVGPQAGEASRPLVFLLCLFLNASLAVGAWVRRSRDAGDSPWRALILFLPGINALYGLYLLVEPSSELPRGDIDPQAESRPASVVPEPAPRTPYVTLTSDRLARNLEAHVARLAQAGIPCKVDVRPGYLGFDLKVPEDEAERAAALLPAVEGEDSAETRSNLETMAGHCPACSAPFAAGATQCSECGLGLTHDVVACQNCGQDLDLATGRCPRCDSEPVAP